MSAGDGHGPVVLALHSSGEALGLGLQPLRHGAERQLAHHPLGRALSNGLLSCLEALLPAVHWPRIARLAVATGPGGFTSTRLTVVLARTLAQQLKVPLHGPSSFLLVARRLLVGGGLEVAEATAGFWVVQELPRRGLVAGLYGLEGGAMVERLVPRLVADHSALETLAPAATPVHSGAVVLPDDVDQLLEWALEAEAAGLPGPWGPVLPLYPTSPVEVV
ncbi:MAG: tRNA (adenosine(37)-N6)-threonylcarbamoyltransferase complex dimerization subunit type 1 TsaB [Cyanobacteriota bacterium]|nr:tRNA (adenosine(37)-N6)-threonylcarbamoyltransferase complex dimerization subunit type 1 TsaB [Cyanobacteriota bacterium]